MLALMIIGGAQTAWAATEEYDFKTFVSNGAPTLTLSSTAVEQKGTNAKTVYVVNNPSNTAGELDLKGRIALDSHASTNQTMRWMWRYTSNAYQQGLGGSWNGNGTAVTSYNISILDLYAGDKITFTYSIRSKKDAYLYTCSAGIISTDGTAEKALAAGTKAVSGTTYTVMADGNLDLYVVNDNMAIHKIVIESDHIAESIDAPAIKVVGANAGDRIVNITSSKTNTDAATTTYYTLDGTDPTSESTKYEGNITVTPANAVEGTVTIKAITFKDGNTSVASEIASLTLKDVGTTLTLNAPIINMNFQKNGSLYNPVYSFVSDQSSVTGSPAVTFSYTIDGGISTVGKSYTANTTGELTVTASANGYASASASTTISNYLFERTFYYDFASFTEHSNTTVGSPTTVNGAGCQAYELASDAVEGITINMNLLWAITANKAVGLFARTGTGSIVYNGELPEGSYIVFSNNGTPVVSTTATTEFGQYGLAKDMAVYVPTNKISISLPADYIYSTFCSEYDLDFTDNADVKAYIAYGDGENVILEQVNRVPGETGVVLEKQGNATTANVPVVEILELTKEEEETLSYNALYPVLDEGEPIRAEDLAVAGNAYILEDDYKFSKVVEGATGEMAIGKAFLLYNAIGGGPLWIKIFDGEATAIKGVEVKAAQADNAIYNLQGVRVSKPTAKGLYIINGKKHLCK